MTEPERTDRRLAGTTALVTGGGRGLGRAIAQALGSAGAAVAIAARSPDELAAALTALRAAGTTAVALQVDVTDRAAVEAIVEQTERELGPIDLLVNNAGTCNAIAPVWEVDPDVWWHEVEIHLRGSFLCARAVVPGMIARGRGRIINMASGVGLLPFPFTSAYSCGKAALMRLTDSLAVSTRALGVHVFAISPGNVRTAMMDQSRELRGGAAMARRSGAARGARVPGAGARGPTLRSPGVGRGGQPVGSLHPRHVRSRRMLGRVAEIEQGDLYTLRLRVLPA